MRVNKTLLLLPVSSFEDLRSAAIFDEDPARSCHLS